MSSRGVAWIRHMSRSKSWVPLMERQMWWLIVWRTEHLFSGQMDKIMCTQHYFHSRMCNELWSPYNNTRCGVCRLSCKCVFPPQWVLTAHLWQMSRLNFENRMLKCCCIETIPTRRSDVCITPTDVSIITSPALYPTVSLGCDGAWGGKHTLDSSPVHHRAHAHT